MSKRTSHGLPGIYNSTPLSLSDGQGAALAVDSAGRLITALEVSGSDIQIGAVEIKNGTDDTRLTVATDDSAMPATPPFLPFGGEYRSSPTTYADGDATVAQSDVNGNLKVTQATLIAGEDLTNNVMKTEQRVTYTNITADTLIKTGAGKFYGFIINSHTSGTLKVWDNTSAATTVLLNTITFAAGPQQWVFPVGIEFSTGLYADVGGTIDITILWR